MAGTAIKVARKMPRAEKDPDTSTYSGRIAARVRELRKKRGLSREELWVKLTAEGCHVGVPSLYNYENGRAKINPDDYPAFAKALGCKSVKDFLPPD